MQICNIQRFNFLGFGFSRTLTHYGYISSVLLIARPYTTPYVTTNCFQLLIHCHTFRKILNPTNSLNIFQKYVNC